MDTPQDNSGLISLPPTATVRPAAPSRSVQQQHTLSAPCHQTQALSTPQPGPSFTAEPESQSPERPCHGSNGKPQTGASVAPPSHPRPNDGNGGGLPRPDPILAPYVCRTCGERTNADGSPADARVVWVGKRAVIQHRRHCPQYDPRLAALLAAQPKEEAPK